MYFKCHLKCTKTSSVLYAHLCVQSKNSSTPKNILVFIVSWIWLHKAHVALQHDIYGLLPRLYFFIYTQITQCRKMPRNRIA